jgi:ribose transport system substrate-binding protein
VGHFNRLSIASYVQRAALFVALFSTVQQSALAASDPTPEEQARTLAEVPDAVRPYYQGYWYSSPIVANPLEHWQPHSPPWQICHNDSYLGNSFRADLVNELKSLVSQLAKQGLAKDNLIVTNSNGDINLELSQLKAEVEQGCDVIFSFPGSATGLCAGVKEAFDKGALFVTIDSPAECLGAINVAQNTYLSGQTAGKWLAKAMGGKGNLVLINGQAGTSNTTAKRQGLLDAVAASPDVKVSGDLYAMWTGSIAKTEMLKFLATHPQPVDAAWSAGLMAVAGAEALAQSGRPSAIVADSTNQCSLLAFWKQHNLNSFTFVQGPRSLGYEPFVAALHILAGQKPKLNTIFMPLPTITNANFDDYYDPSMTVQSTCWADGKDPRLVSDDYFDQFFTGGNPAAKVSP